MDLKEKVAIVTGGARGIGASYTNVLLKQGMRICIVDIKEDIANEFIGELSESFKNKVIFQKCDASCFTELKAVFEKVISTFGRIDMVINNAGMLNEIDWRKMVDVNLIGVVNGIKLAFEYMDKSRNGNGGHVINTASRAGLEGRALNPVYSATKHAVIGLTKSYGADYHFQKTGITVNGICPGAVDTELFRTAESYLLDPDEGRKMLEQSVKIGPDDVANALLKLLVDGKNGVLLKIDEHGLKYVD